MRADLRIDHQIECSEPLSNKLASEWNLVALSKPEKLETREPAHTDAESAERIQYLNRKFNIETLPGGIELPYPEAPSDERVKLRFPSKLELEIIEKTLSKFAHIAAENSERMNFSGLRFGFVSSEFAAKVEEWGWHVGGANPALLFGPRVEGNSAGWRAFEGTLLHEFVHQLQELLWKDKQGVDTVPDELMNFFSYERVESQKGTETFRLKSQDGKSWQYEETADGNFWFPVVNGDVVMNKDRALTDETLRDRLAAEKLPATDYFTSPVEAHAEALGMYLLDRESLWQVNPHLYELIKRMDQSDIDRRFGPAVKIRNLQGELVDRNDEIQQEIEQAERSWKRQLNSPADGAYQKKLLDHEFTMQSNRGPLDDGSALRPKCLGRGCCSSARKS